MIVLKCCRCDGIKLKPVDEDCDQSICEECGIVDIDLECDLVEMSLDEIVAKV